METLFESSLLRAMELTFNRELPGFAGAHHFSLQPIGDSNGSVVAKLISRDPVVLQNGATVDNLTLLVVAPGVLWRDYQVNVDQILVDELEIETEEDVIIMAIVHPHNQPALSTANLYSPIVVNRVNGFAEQLIPNITESESGWSIRTPFPQDEEI